MERDFLLQGMLQLHIPSAVIGIWKQGDELTWFRLSPDGLKQFESYSDTYKTVQSVWELAPLTDVSADIFVPSTADAPSSIIAIEHVHADV